MISEFKFFSELKFLLKNNKSFVVFKKPSHNKIVCQQGDVIDGQISDMSGKRGFIFMPFNLNLNGYLLMPKVTIETQFKSELNKNQKTDFDLKDFNLKKSFYVDFVKNTITEIKNSSLEKVVCSSSFNLKFKSKSIIQYFIRLLQLNHDAFCYLFYHPEIGVWIGASPEKLLNLNNDDVTTFALAATKKEMNQSWTDKEFREQKIVEEQIVTDLERGCSNIETGALQTVKAGNIYHLKSVIRAKTNKSPTDLIRLLHPTPAIAGTPKNKAISYINKMENYNRSFYTGFMGLFEKNSCDIYVNIRCAKIIDDNLTIYVGGGITKDSNASDEWNEILNKSQTMLGVFHSP
tara:strand:- start:6649 stop:7692 length:1044 start_codon:yes stop_codon:yes gene_type:complete